jgi:hypothetical protein
MVTLILLFVFLSPKVINFNDKPVERNPQSTGVVVIPDGRDGLIYQIEGRAVQSKEDAGIRADLQSIIEPVSGEVSMSRYEVVRAHSGRVLSPEVGTTIEKPRSGAAPRTHGSRFGLCSF